MQSCFEVGVLNLGQIIEILWLMCRLFLRRGFVHLETCFSGLK